MTRVIRFTMNHCMPCKMLAPTFEQLESEFENVEFETIDVDGNRDAVVEYGVKTVPTVIVEQNGHVLDTIVGLQSKENYEKVIKLYSN